jgi:hypothetical protein
MSQATAEQAITTVEALPAELRAELVTKREAEPRWPSSRRVTRRWHRTSSGPCCRRCPGGIEPKPATRKPQAPKLRRWPSRPRPSPSRRNRPSPQGRARLGEEGRRYAGQAERPGSPAKLGEDRVQPEAGAGDRHEAAGGQRGATRVPPSEGRGRVDRTVGLLGTTSQAPGHEPGAWRLRRPA